MSTHPRISVVIPAFNAARFIEATLDSVRRQTRAPHEILVVDDDSSDQTAEIAARAGGRVISSPSNRGVSTARNIGMTAATGDSIALLDADDLWKPGHLELVGGLLDAHPDAALAYSRAEKFGDETGPTRRTLPPGKVQDAFASAVRVNLSPTCCAVFRRRVALELDGFDDRMRYGEDFDFWMRLSARYPVVGTDEITARYRIHTVGKGDTRAVAQEGQCRARYRMWQALRSAGDEDRRALLEHAMMECWGDHLRAAWQDGDRATFDRMLALHELVPGSDPRRRRWARRRPLFPARRVWNRLPDPARNAIKRVLRVLGRDAGSV